MVAVAVAEVVIIAANSCCRTSVASPPMGDPFWSRWQPEGKEGEAEIEGVAEREERERLFRASREVESGFLIK